MTTDMVPQALGVGVGGLDMSTAAYSFLLRLFAEGWQPSRAMREVRARFPDDEITRHQVRRVKETRQTEIQALRARLNDAVSDLWICQKRQRLLALQDIYEDCNRWVPDKVVVEAAEGESRGVVSHKKNVDGMLKALRQAREELGEGASERQAGALERLAAAAEAARGLEQTVEVGSAPDFETVPELQDALLIDAPRDYHTAGDDSKRGFLRGDVDRQDDGEGAVHGSALQDVIEGGESEE